MACPAKSRCSCLHVVQESERWGLLAACCCEDWECDTFRIQPDDVAIYELERERLGGALVTALGLGKHVAARHEGPGLFEIGMCVAAAAPVYLGMGDSNALARGIGRLTGVREGPFMLVTPTGKACDQDVERLLQQHGAGHISLSSVLEVRMGANGVEFVPNGAAAPSLSRFVERVTKSRGGGSVLAKIHQEIAAVRSDFVELRSAKQRLEKMLAEGFFAFTQKVDAESFKVFCTILAEGDVAKAGRVLSMADSTLRDVLGEWRHRGDAYKALLDVVRWRKSVGRRETVRLHENVILGKTGAAEQPGLLAEVLDGLLSMTEENWRELTQELVEALQGSGANG
jgi:hypothetical protein